LTLFLTPVLYCAYKEFLFKLGRLETGDEAEAAK
jgi:hypothetical protein